VEPRRPVTGATLKPVAGATLLGALALAHAGLTWPVVATVALFGGGALVAFVAEAVVIQRGWLEHHVGPQVVGVPLYVLPGWTGTIYVAFRIAQSVSEGWLAVVLAAILAAGFDAVSDPLGVAAGYWTFTGGPGGATGPSYRGVPWWNAAGWVVVSAITAALALPFL
jgi:uncharacterized membrane protein